MSDISIYQCTITSGSGWGRLPEGLLHSILDYIHVFLNYVDYCFYYAYMFFLMRCKIWFINHMFLL